MVIRSRRQEKPAVEEAADEPVFGIVIIDVWSNPGLSQEELEDIKRIFEQIRRDLDSIVQGP